MSLRCYVFSRCFSVFDVVVIGAAAYWLDLSYALLLSFPYAVLSVYMAKRFGL